MLVKFTEQTNLAHTDVGDWVYTTPKATRTKDGLHVVQLENPDHDKGIARQVVDNVKGNGERYLIFHDATRSVPRAATAFAYRFLLTTDGKPMTVPTYPVCPTCGADGPSCHTKSGTWTSWHKSREKVMRERMELAKANINRPKPVLPKCPVCHQAGAQCWDHTDTGSTIRAEWHPERTAVKDHANGAERKADLVDASYVAPEKRVHKDPEGNVWIEGWVGGEGEHVTPEGWRVHVTATGVVTVIGKAARTDDEVDEALAGEPELQHTERCVQCKGFGLVRKRGANKGERYKTMNGALQAQSNGNAVQCPRCHGNGDLAVAA